MKTLCIDYSPSGKPVADSEVEKMILDSLCNDSDKNLGFFNTITKYSKSQYEFSSRG